MINKHNFSGLFFRENRTYCPKDGVHNVIKLKVTRISSDYKTLFISRLILIWISIDILSVGLFI